MVPQYTGNMELLKMQKVAFLASGTISTQSVLRCYDWATQQCNNGVCVVSGFHSKLEQDTLHLLLQTQCPVIWVIARKMYKNISDKLQQAFEGNRLLIISVSSQSRQSVQSCAERNKYILHLADKIVFASINPNSSLHPLLKEVKDIGKEINIIEMGNQAME